MKKGEKVDWALMGKAGLKLFASFKNIEIYANGNYRVAINKETQIVILIYEVGR